MWLNKVVRILAAVFWVISLNGCYTMIQRDCLSNVEEEPVIIYVPVYLPDPPIPPVPVSPQPQAPLIKYRSPESNSSERQGTSGRLRDNDGNRSENNNNSQNGDRSRSTRR